MTEVLELLTGDDASAWAALGFAVEPAGVRVGRVLVRCDGQGGGIRGWTLNGATGPREVAGISTTWSPAGRAPEGARALDHLVLTVGRLNAAVKDLVANGGDERLRRDDLHAPMAFVRMGSTIVEVVQRKGPPVLWGLVAIVDDVDRLNPALVGPAKDAVQPGRRIATVRPEAGLGTALAFMTPRVRTR